MPNKSLWLLAAAAALPAVPAIAQDAEPVADSTDGPEIIVTGRGLEETPATPAYDVQTIEREELVSTASGRLEDALANVAGFQQFRR